MFNAIAANAVLLLHLLFIVFVVAGGLLLFRWPRLIYAHLPAAAWGALIEFAGWICPLTPLENRFRIAAGQQGYSGGFIEHYLLAIIYPDGLSRSIQITLGVFVVVLNATIYYRIWRSKRRADSPSAPDMK